MGSIYWHFELISDCSKFKERRKRALFERNLMQTLKKRREFLRINSLKQSWVTPGFIIQAAQTENRAGQPDQHSFSVGFTASRKVGNAVKRNFAKRRLRALAYHILKPNALPGLDYVMIARPAILSLGFAQLEADLVEAIHLLHKKYGFLPEEWKA